MSGREMSGDLGPSPSSFFGAHGGGSTGFWIRSAIARKLTVNPEKASLPPGTAAFATGLLLDGAVAK